MAHRRTGLALAVTCIPAFMVALDLLVVTIALSTIRTSLHASMQELGWTVNAYTISFGVLILLGSMLGDRLGRRRMFSLGLVVFTGASAVCALAPTTGMLIAARAVQGSGAALISPLSLTLSTAAFPPGARGKVIGIWGAVTGSAVALGPLVGGLVVQGLSWPWIFWLNVPIGLVAILATPRLLAESHGPRRPIDVPGIVLASAGLTALIWGILRGNDSGWTSAEILVALGGGAVLLTGFAVRQLRTATPMVPRHLFRSRDFVTGNLVIFLVMGSLMGAAFLLPQYLQSGLHHSVLGTGALLLPWTAAPMFLTPVAGTLADRIGNRPLMFAGALLQGAGFLWIALVAGPHAGYGTLFGPLLVSGIGISLVFPTSVNTVVGAVSPADLGVASAVMASFRQLGGPFGVAVIAAIFQRDGGFGSPAAFSDGLVPAMSAASVITLAGCLTALATRRRTRPVVAPEPERVTA